MLFAILGASGLASPSPSAQEAVDYLQRYLRIDTSNPPGDTLESGRFLASILEKEGIPVTVYESLQGRKVNVLARLKASVEKGLKPLLLLHHMDVVPADPERWPVDPFGGVIRDGFIWGRGAMDMKGHGILHLMTMLELKRNGIPLERDVLFLAVSDEEIGGGLGAAWMLEHHWEELDPEYVLDEGGVGFDGFLAPGRVVFGISVTEKQVLWLRLSAEGVAGHGSQPIAENANEILVQALARVLSAPPEPGDHEVLDILRRELGSLAENKFTRAIQANTISLTTLEAGVGDPPKVNVIPSLSRATLDCRLLPGTPVEPFLSRLEEIIGDPRVQIEVLYRSVGKETTPHNTPLYHSMRQVLQRHFPEVPVVPLIIPYGTDAADFRVKGVKAYGFLPVVVGEEILGSMHSDSERIPLEGFQRGVLLFYEMVRDFVRVKDSN